MRVRRRCPALLIVGVALGCAAISCKSEPASGRALKRRGIGPVQQPGQASPDAPQPVNMGPIDPIAAGATPASAASPAVTDEAPTKAPRDFGAELARMLGNPVDCLTARAEADAPSQLDIALTTQVMPSGAVAQSEAQATGLTPSELTCVRNRVEGLHFAAPIENAPFAVHGNLHLTRAATVVAVAAPAPNPEDAPNPQAPNTDTPAPTPTDTAPVAVAPIKPNSPVPNTDTAPVAAAPIEPNSPVPSPADGVAQP